MGNDADAGFAGDAGLDRPATVLTEFCIGIMSFLTTMRTHFMFFLFSSYRHRHFRSDDACRHGNDAITGEHDNAGNKLSDRRNRPDIAIANGCDRNNCPIYTVGYTPEIFVLTSLDQVHHRTHDDDRGKYNKQEDRDLFQATGNSAAQKTHFR